MITKKGHCFTLCKGLLNWSVMYFLGIHGVGHMHVSKSLVQEIFLKWEACSVGGALKIAKLISKIIIK